MENLDNYLDPNSVDERFREQVEWFNIWGSRSIKSASELKREIDACVNLWNVLIEEGWSKDSNKGSHFMHKDYPGILLAVEPQDVHAVYLPLNIYVMPDSQDHDTRWPASWVKITDSFIDADIFRIPRKKMILNSKSDKTQRLEGALIEERWYKEYTETDGRPVWRSDDYPQTLIEIKSDSIYLLIPELSFECELGTDFKLTDDYIDFGNFKINRKKAVG